MVTLFNTLGGTLTVMSSWLLLFFAIVTEVSGTTCMKLSKGFTELWPTILVFVFYGFSFTASTFALKTIDLSIAYAVWMGLGTAIIVVIGMIWFKESLSLVKALALLMIIVGVVLLNVSSSRS
jgi:small multidrug resistance pump